MDEQLKQIVTGRRKSMVVAYVLLLFGGGLGLHRFYLGHFRSGATLAAIAFGAVFTIPLVAPALALLMIFMVWIVADLFLTAVMVQKANQRAGMAASYAAAPQRLIREDAFEERPREEEKQQRAEEAQRRQEAEARAGAKVAPSIPQQLASVSGIVDLSLEEALDEARGFLTRQGYDVVERTDHSLTTQRGGQQFFLPDSASTYTSTLEILVHPQPGDGVQIKIMGHEFDPVLMQQQAQWKEWAATLPKKMGEEDVSGAVAQGYAAREEVSTVEEGTTVSRREADSDGERDISHLLERFEAAEDRLGVRLQGLFARIDEENRYIHLNGELHAQEGSKLIRDVEVVATTHGPSGKIVHRQSTGFHSGSFVGSKPFSLSIEAGEEHLAKIRVYPKVL